MLAIRSLSLHHFRNYDTLSLDAGGESVILTGPNGAGKTNILEAISLLSPGRGMRKAKLADLKSKAQDTAWVIAANIQGLQGPMQLGTALDIESASEKRLVKIDGDKARSQNLLAEHLAISWHIPQMDGLFLAAESERRRFLDRLIFAFDAAHLTRITRYEHAMRERNRLLEQLHPDGAWLNALEETMAQQGVAIAIARSEGAARLNAAMNHLNSAFPKAALKLCGEMELLLEALPASDVEQEWQVRLSGQRRRDAAAGRSLSGPHRSALEVLHRTRHMAAAHCSTGEQKALLMSIILAHAEARKAWLGAAPILLLDEVAAHLDQARRAALATTLEALGAQVWMTGTDAADFCAFERFSRHLNVTEGKIVAL